MESTEYLLRVGGEIIRRSITENEIIVPDALLAKLQGNVVLPIRNLLVIQEWGTVNALFSNESVQWWTVPVRRIMLKAPYKLVEKVMVPIFDSKTETRIEMRWDPPEGMRIILLMMIQRVNAFYHIPKCYLYAVDQRPEYWRLPLPNVFDDGAICEGRQIRKFGSMLEAALNMLETFDNSNWNADLWNDVEKTHRMFRFEAIDGGGFKTLPMDANSWITLCRKTVNSAIQKNILL